MKVIGVIPARYNSSRLEGKPLADIHGKPMVQYVYEIARKARHLDSVVVATDDERIAAAVGRFGGQVAMTSPAHASGTDRVAEVASASGADIVVNVQGDEPLLDPEMIDECVQALKDALLERDGVGISTVIKKIGENSYHDASVVKVVRDARGRALYFSRSLIPYPRHPAEPFDVFEHIGLYAYTRECLARLSQMPPARLSASKASKQLRALENGISIQVVETRCTGELVSVIRPKTSNASAAYFERSEAVRPPATAIAAWRDSLPASTLHHLDQAISSVVEAKQRGGRVVVVTGSGPNLHEGVTTQIAELIRHGLVDGVITSSAVVAHEMAGTLDRVKRVRIDTGAAFEIPTGLLPRGSVFEINQMPAAQRRDMEKNFWMAGTCTTACRRCPALS